MSGDADARPGAPERVPPWMRYVLAAVFAAYGWFIAANMGAVPAGSDSSGYFNQARVLAKFETQAPLRELPTLSFHEAPSIHLYAPLGSIPAADGRALVMTYPIGFPLLLTLTSLVVGWAQAGNVVVWLHVMAGLIVIFLWLRACGASPLSALAGTGIAASSALYINMGLMAMSDVPAMVWVTGAVLAAWSSRSRPWLALIAGAAFASAVLIRPSNAIAVLPAALALGTDWRRWVLFGLGGLPGAVLLGVYNFAAYGRLLASGYGDLSGLFQWSFIPVTLRAYAMWLPVVFSPLVFLAFFLPGGGRWRDCRTWINLAWAFAFLACFAAYRHTHEAWWYMRFVLPMMPAALAGGIIVMETWTQRLRKVGQAKAAAACLCALAILWQVAWSKRYNVQLTGQGERVYAEVVAWVERNLPPDAILCAMQASGALFFATDLTILRWDAVPAAGRDLVSRALRDNGGPVFAVLWPFEHPEALQRLGGDWEGVGHVRNVTIWRQTRAAAQD